MARTPPGRIRVLHVDDDRAFADVTAASLERADGRLRVETARDADAGLAALRERTFDCVVSDYDMPGANGIEFLRAVRDADDDLPFILFTGTGSEDVASDAISAGVSDYLRKSRDPDQFEILANRVANYVEKHRANRQRDRQIEAIEAAREGISILDADRRFVYVSESFAGLYGYAREELLGEPWSRTVSDADAARLREDVVPAVEETGYWYGTTAGRRSDGSAFPADCVLATTERGELVYTARDVAEREARERELEAQRAFIEQSLDAIADVFYVVDRDGSMRRWNDRLSAVTGHDDAAVAEMDAVDFFPADERERVRAALEETVDSGSARLEADVFDADGERVPYDFTGSRFTDAQGDLLGVIGTARDVSERREHERELRRIERRYRAIFDDPHILVGILDVDGTVRDVNATAMGYVDASLDDLVGVPFAQTPWFAHSEGVRDDIEAWISRAADGEYVNFETDLERPSGDPYAVEGVFRPVVDEDGDVVSIVVSDREVTERNGRERELEAQNERLDAFASVVSHDLRTPLLTARESLDLAREAGEVAESGGAHVERAGRALDRMSRIIDDVLWLAREGRDIGETESVDLGAAVEHAWVVAAGTCPPTDLTGASALPTLDADPDRLGQLLENLIRNALEHGAADADGGAGATVRVVALEDGFAVEDDGPGFADADAARLFERGYTTREGGTGLGLAIVEQVASAHGWTVRVAESALGGARVEVTGVDAGGDANRKKQTGQ